jgi:hypothetical protein
MINQSNHALQERGRSAAEHAADGQSSSLSMAFML